MIRAEYVDGQRIFRQTDTGFVFYPDDLIVLECFRGKSPIRLHMENLGITAAAMEYGARFFGTGGNIGGFLMTDKSLTDDQYFRLKNTWSAQHQGIHNAHETAILEHGLKFERSTIPPDEAQFIATRKFQVEEVARNFWNPANPHSGGRGHDVQQRRTNPHRIHPTNPHPVGASVRNGTRPKVDSRT